MDQELPEHAQKNRIVWGLLGGRVCRVGTTSMADGRGDVGNLPRAKAELGVFPESVRDWTSSSWGAGTAYISAWLARRGAHPVGIDNSQAQLATARRMQEQFGLEAPSLTSGSPRKPRFPDAGFDLAVSEYGAWIRRDPYPLDSRGCSPPAPRRRQPGLPGQRRAFDALPPARWPEYAEHGHGVPGATLYFGMHRVEWPNGWSQSLSRSWGLDPSAARERFRNR